MPLDVSMLQARQLLSDIFTGRVPNLIFVPPLIPLILSPLSKTAMAFQSLKIVVFSTLQSF